MVYQFGGWEVDLARRELRARGVPVPLGGRAFQLFAVLVQSAGELVTKDELMARVWPGAIVEENKLQVHISAVRRALRVASLMPEKRLEDRSRWRRSSDSTPAIDPTMNCRGCAMNWIRVSRSPVASRTA